MTLRSSIVVLAIVLFIATAVVGRRSEQPLPMLRLPGPETLMVDWIIGTGANTYGVGEWHQSAIPSINRKAKRYSVIYLGAHHFETSLSAAAIATIGGFGLFIVCVTFVGFRRNHLGYVECKKSAA